MKLLWRHNQEIGREMAVKGQGRGGQKRKVVDQRSGGFAAKLQYLIALAHARNNYHMY